MYSSISEPSYDSLLTSVVNKAMTLTAYTYVYAVDFFSVLAITVLTEHMTSVLSYIIVAPM